MKKTSVLLLSSAFLALLIPALVCLAAGAQTQNPNLKSDSTESLRSVFPPAKGWSMAKLAEAREYAEKAGSSAVVVVHDGKLAAEWGDTTTRMCSHSVRKSLISALFGIAVHKKMINLKDTLEYLGIDDKPPSLTKQEKQAKVSDLLKARSGVYHPAAWESEGMKKKRPKRGSHAPGTFWYYNNWDFNVLGAIFEKKTGLKIGGAFKKWIAGPIGMQDFREEDVQYAWDEVSEYPAYPFWVTARDLARFGVLFLQNGRWQGKQVIPSQWVKDSITPYSKFKNGGYGYMWWIAKTAYYAAGWGGQKVAVFPKEKAVIVNQVNTGSYFARNYLPKWLGGLYWKITGNVVTSGEFRNLVKRIYRASPEHISKSTVKNYQKEK